MHTLFSEETGSELVVHLDELRTRILWTLAAVVIGAVVGWLVYPRAYHLLADPVLNVVTAHGGMVFTLQPTEAFFTRCRLAMVLGVILASPVAIYQLWAFVRPGLTVAERRAIAPLMPAISVLFLLGAGLAYVMLPNIMTFLQGYVPAGVRPNLEYQSTINFPLKLMLAFGLAFQLPVLLLGLVALGVLTPAILLKQWRIAVVAIAVIAAVVTPTGDPFNFALLMAPLLLLYFGTVLVAHKMRRQTDPS